MFQQAQQEGSISLARVLTLIFDDSFIYSQPGFYNLITQSPQGWVSVKQIMLTPAFVKYQQDNSQLHITPQRVVECINSQCEELVARNYRVRRMQPFVDRIKTKELQFVYVERFRRPDVAAIRRFFEGIVGRVYQVYSKPLEQWVILLIDNYAALEPLKGSLVFDDQTLTVKSPQETILIYGDQERLSYDYRMHRVYENKKCIMELMKLGHNVMEEQEHEPPRRRERPVIRHNLLGQEEQHEREGDDEVDNEDEREHGMKKRQIKRKFIQFLSIDNSGLLPTDSIY